MTRNELRFRGARFISIGPDEDEDLNYIKVILSVPYTDENRKVVDNMNDKWGSGVWNELVENKPWKIDLVFSKEYENGFPNIETMILENELWTCKDSRLKGIPKYKKDLLKLLSENFLPIVDGRI